MKNLNLLDQLIDQKYIKVQQHPDADLFIYNYTAKAQYERVWNEITLNCRGLIMDADRNIVARPFAKFFNLGELEETQIPNMPFEVYDKMDGSLGILYWVENTPFIATRGSFNSDQAVKATHMLHTTYADAIKHLNPDHTYLFEIIYPENRIVVDYGAKEELVLLAVIDSATGEEFELPEIGLPLVKRYHGIHDFKELVSLQEANREGFVVKFHNNFRLKVKFDEYVRLHRILTQVTSYTIWEQLKAGETLDMILEAVPDEFYGWVRATEQKFREDFAKIEREAHAEFQVFDTRKEAALYYMEQTHPSILFKMLDEKPYHEIIWKKIKPEYEKPFN